MCVVISNGCVPTLANGLLHAQLMKRGRMIILADTART